MCLLSAQCWSSLKIIVKNFDLFCVSSLIKPVRKVCFIINIILLEIIKWSSCRINLFRALLIVYQKDLDFILTKELALILIDFLLQNLSKFLFAFSKMFFYHASVGLSKSSYLKKKSRVCNSKRFQLPFFCCCCWCYNLAIEHLSPWRHDCLTPVHQYWVRSEYH